MATEINPDQVRNLVEFMQETSIRLKALEALAEREYPTEYRQALEQARDAAKKQAT